MIQLIGWLIAAASMIGTILNIYKKRSCFVWWGLSCLAWVAYDPVGRGASPPFTVG